jgi:probable phosphoglycerate mutase
LSKSVLTVVRHGETDWSRTGRHTSFTDVALTPAGEAQARQLGEALAGIHFDLVLCSPRLRARRTAELAGLVPFEIDEELVEWDYGELEGETSAQIQEQHPGWNIWNGPWPGGEQPPEVAARADRVLGRVLAVGEREAQARDQALVQDEAPVEDAAPARDTPPARDVPPARDTPPARIALVGHGHFSRVLAVRWIRQEVRAGERLDLDTGTWSELGWNREVRVLRHWNVPVVAHP